MTSFLNVVYVVLMQFYVFLISWLKPLEAVDWESYNKKFYL